MLGLDKHTFKESFSFGLNVIVMSMLCALSGIFHKKKRDIMYIIFVTGFANIIPDIYAYYLMQRQKNVSISEAIVTTLPLGLAEMLSITFISMPLLFLNNKYTRFFAAIGVGAILVIISTYLNEEKEATLTNFVEPIVVTLIGVSLTYFLTSAGDKYLMPLVDSYIKN